jgi:hypothetical protein
MQVKNRIALACACALAALIGASALRADTPPDPPAVATTTIATAGEPFTPELSQRQRQRQIDRYRHRVWRWERVMGVRVTRRLPHAPADFSAKVDAWQREAVRMWRRAQNPPHKNAWLCIHHYEGSWRDPNPPYYGGLQMDVQFQRTYGATTFRRKGTADHWTPLEQMWAAERAHRAGRGFYPWPNTARYCGLI